MLHLEEYYESEIKKRYGDQEVTYPINRPTILSLDIINISKFYILDMLHDIDEINIIWIGLGGVGINFFTTLMDIWGEDLPKLNIILVDPDTLEWHNLFRLRTSFKEFPSETYDDVMHNSHTLYKVDILENIYANTLNNVSITSFRNDITDENVLNSIYSIVDMTTSGKTIVIESASRRVENLCKKYFELEKNIPVISLSSDGKNVWITRDRTLDDSPTSDGYQTIYPDDFITSCEKATIATLPKAIRLALDNETFFFDPKEINDTFGSVIKVSYTYYLYKQSSVPIFKTYFDIEKRDTETFQINKNDDIFVLVEDNSRRKYRKDLRSIFSYAKFFDYYPVMEIDDKLYPLPFLVALGETEYVKLLVEEYEYKIKFIDIDLIEDNYDERLFTKQEYLLQKYIKHYKQATSPKIEITKNIKFQETSYGQHILLPIFSAKRGNKHLPVHGFYKIDVLESSTPVFDAELDIEILTVFPFDSSFKRKLKSDLITAILLHQEHLDPDENSFVTRYRVPINLENINDALLELQHAKLEEDETIYQPAYGEILRFLLNLAVHELTMTEW